LKNLEIIVRPCLVTRRNMNFCIAEDDPKKEPKRSINHGILYLN